MGLKQQQKKVNIFGAPSLAEICQPIFLIELKSFR